MECFHVFFLIKDKAHFNIVYQRLLFYPMHNGNWIITKRYFMFYYVLHVISWLMEHNRNALIQAAYFSFHNSTSIELEALFFLCTRSMNIWCLFFPGSSGIVTATNALASACCS